MCGNTLRFEAEEAVRRGKVMDITRTLKQNKVPTEIIAKSTGLSLEEIDQL